jgi:hypothetical protein
MCGLDAAFFDAVARVERDLQTRFPAIAVRPLRDDEGLWIIDVRDGGERWGWLGGWADDDLGPSASEYQEFTYEIACQIADNLWPDELTEPWPLCPAHQDHPLQPALIGKRAHWACYKDDSVRTPIGALANTSLGA